MFGFGDAGSSSKDTVHVMEDLLNRFITDLVRIPPSLPLLRSFLLGLLY